MTVRRNVGEEIEKVPLLADQGLEHGAKTYVASSSFHDEESTEVPMTAHQISKDSWIQICFVLTVNVNSAFIMGYSEAIMVHLGWIAGVVSVIAASALSLHASILLAKLYELDGKRHIRFRDLAGHIYGKQGYYTVWVLQYVDLFMINIAYIVLAGSAIKGVYDLFREDNALKLPYCNLIAGFVCFLFAIIVPHLSAVGVWLGLSAVLTSIYALVAVVVSISDGLKEPARDYSIPAGTLVEKIILAMESISSSVVPFNTGMVPEIQATVRAPAVGNMKKALCVQFTAGVLPIYSVIFSGYWAYGSSVSSYLINSLSGPVWAKALAYVAANFQAVINFHICACPIYEYLDTKYGVKGSASAIRNLSFRAGARGSYLAVSAFIAALLPFIGDLIGLIGSICLVPLSLVIPHHLYVTAEKKNLSSLQKLWHWFNVIFFGLFSVAATVASLRRIIIDSKNYKIFG